MVKYDADAPAEDTVYIIDDVRYFNQLNHVGLTVDKNDADTAGAFRFIHLLGPHYPYSYNEKGEYIGTDKSTMMKQAQGSLYMVQTYLQQLKDMGLYDEATIIVTADHGTWWLTNEPLKQASCPILMVKPRQSAEDAQAPAAVTTAPVSHADILPTIRQSIGLEGRGTHEGVSSVYDFEPIDSLERVRWYYTTNTETRKELAIIEYAILGDAGSIANWQLTGVSWDPAPAEE